MASSTPTSPTSPTGRRRGTSVSSVGHSIQSFSQTVVSATEHVLDSDLPPGFFAATAEATSGAPTLQEIRRGSIGQQSARREGRRPSQPRRTSRGHTAERPLQIQEHPLETDAFPALSEEPTHTSSFTEALDKPEQKAREGHVEGTQLSQRGSDSSSGPLQAGERGEGSQNHTAYIHPPKLPWTTSTAVGLKAFWKWFLTPFGFLLTLYGLNVVAWGGMLFLLLLNASPAMCWTSDGHGGKFHDCNNINSPRRKWIEWDSQILNALFCVTGFGLAPWRFRDLYYILSYRFTNERKAGYEKKMWGLRKLAGHYRNWFRLPGSQTLDELNTAEYTKSAATFDPRIPIPETKKPADPLTGERAPPTVLWKVDFFIWCQVWNTFFQCCLCGFMWALNRYNRPSWATGLFVALACIIAGIGGIVSYIEGRKIKRIEGVAWSPAQVKAFGGSHTDVELGLQQTSTEHESIHLEQKKGEAPQTI